MKLKKTSALYYLDFDISKCLFSLRNARILAAYFKLLDTHNQGSLNDIQFCNFMHHVTDLTKNEIMLAFDMMDCDRSGEISFDEFYMLAAILFCSEFGVEKTFICHYSSMVFKLLDISGDRAVSFDEFQSLGFLFNLKGPALNKIFYEFDVSGDKNLDDTEFKMFAMACIDMQEETKKKKQKSRRRRVQNAKK